MTFSEWILTNGENLQFILFFAALPVLAIAERLAPRRTGPMDRWVRWPTNYFLTFVNVLALSALPISFIGAAFWAETNGWGVLHQIHLPLAALVAANLLVRGFISFFTHYLMHMVPALWRVHRVHHLDTELDVSSTVRFHPLEFFIALVPGVPIVVAFGLHTVGADVLRGAGCGGEPLEPLQRAPAAYCRSCFPVPRRDAGPSSGAPLGTEARDEQQLRSRLSDLGSGLRHVPGQPARRARTDAAWS